MRTSLWKSALSPVLLLLSAKIPSVESEIRTFHGELEAASNYIHFSEGYLVTPGYVDLTKLTFTTSDEDSEYDYHERADDDYESNFDADDMLGEDDTTSDKDEGEEGGYNDRGGEDEVDEEGDGGDLRLLDTEFSGTSTFIDVVLFHEPKSCSDSNGCLWTGLGVGKDDGEGNLRWCCSDDAIELGLCDGSEDHKGRLIIDPKTFKGEHRFLTVPASGKLEETIKYGKIDEKGETGKYVLVMANCSEKGRNVKVDGKYEWKSKHGYLPGNLFGELYFFVTLTVIYFLTFLWYSISMKCNEDSIIPIQQWILLTIFIGLLEVFFKGGDFFVWNEDGVRLWFAMYTGIILGVSKRAISRCLIVMVSLGWGVIRDTLGEQMKKIIALGFIYFGCSTARDIMTVFGITENQLLSIDQEEEIFDLVTILTFVVAAMDVTFYMWILDSLNGTMQYLENMSQNMKLQRYLRLRCILLFSILFAVVWAVFGIVDNLMDGHMMEVSNEWLVSAVWELNYLIVLIAVAWLWKPDPKAKEYAYVMELPTLGGDVEFETNADTIEDTDDAETDDKDDFKDESENDDGLKIDDAVNA
mmetsp:Transcript_16206/g.21489  ORF Transcript_16206/g.21489 Transcript_16206/m.21489 type:complete len:584 (-) Transcript_16206:558-2309(-)